VFLNVNGFTCVQQACAFRDSYEKFKKAGAEVIGISGDDSASHKVHTSKISGFLNKPISFFRILKRVVGL